MTSFWRWGIGLICFCGLVWFFNRPSSSVVDLSYFSIEQATTTAARMQGLSGHAPLTATQGMLFVFDTADTYTFWMKDMLFPIDIVWLDEAWNVVDVTEHATPASYYTYPPTTFRPRKPARYVLELAAGEAAQLHIVKGIHISGL
jgi:uncharacterized membrane protein (UPF0127 family)